MGVKVSTWLQECMLYICFVSSGSIERFGLRPISRRPLNGGWLRKKLPLAEETRDKLR